MARKKIIYYRDWSELPVLLTTANCAVILETSQQCVTRLIQSGKVPGAAKIGKNWYVNKVDLQNYFEKGSEQNA